MGSGWANFEEQFAQDVAAGRAELKRWLKDETIRIAWTEDGQWYPKGALFPLAILAENEQHPGAFGAEVSTRCSGGLREKLNHAISRFFRRLGIPGSAQRSQLSRV